MDPKAKRKVLPDEEYFLTIPWCHSLITAPGIRTWVPKSARQARSAGEMKGQDAFFAQTLNTPLTIPALLLFYREPAARGQLVREMRGLVALGEGLSGWAGVAHGGAVTAILDEVTGLMPTLQKKWGALEHAATMTRMLNTEYLRPVRCPSVVQIVARIDRQEGRKMFVSARVEDQEGAVLTRAQVLFIAGAPKL
jgi:acyl-coenzyme A thioesterase PaaI-like protein